MISPFYCRLYPLSPVHYPPSHLNMYFSQTFHPPNPSRSQSRTKTLHHHTTSCHHLCVLCIRISPQNPTSPPKKNSVRMLVRQTFSLTAQSLRVAFPTPLLQWSTGQGAAAVAVAAAAARQTRQHAAQHAGVSQRPPLFVVCVVVFSLPATSARTIFGCLSSTRPFVFYPFSLACDHFILVFVERIELFKSCVRDYCMMFFLSSIMIWTHC